VSIKHEFQTDSLPTPIRLNEPADVHAQNNQGSGTKYQQIYRPFRPLQASDKDIFQAFRQYAHSLLLSPDSTRALSTLLFTSITNY
jgi:hypothetical protein